VSVFTQVEENLVDEVIHQINYKNTIVEIHTKTDMVEKSGKYWKDLSKIKPDLSKVMLITTNSENVVQKENTIKIPMFTETSKEDDCLKRLGEMLEFEMSSESKPVDLRKVCKNIESNWV